jgi:hypothetical protein
LFLFFQHNNMESLNKAAPNWTDLYELDLLTGQIKDRASGEVVYWGIDRQECAYEKERQDWLDAGWRFSWAPQLQKCYDFLDGIFMGVWFCKHTNRWIVSTNGDHTLSIISSVTPDVHENIEMHLSEAPWQWQGLWGPKAAQLDVSAHPRRAAIAKVLKEEKFTMLMQMLKPQQCYTFIVVHKDLRAIGLEPQDLAGREEDLKYGLYHLSTRHICPDKPALHLVEIDDLVTGLKRPMLRHFDNKERMESVRNSVGVGQVGVHVTESKPSGGRKSLRRLFVMNPFWMSIYDLRAFSVPRLPLDYDGMGNLNRKLGESDFAFMRSNREAMEVMTEMVLQKEMGVVQSYKSMREQYQVYMKWIAECVRREVTADIRNNLGEEPTLENVEDVTNLPKLHKQYFRGKAAIESKFLAKSAPEVVEQLWSEITSCEAYERWWEEYQAEIERFIAKQTGQMKEATDAAADVQALGMTEM